VASSKGDYNWSRNCFQKALEIRQKLVESDDPGIAEIHHHIGSIYYCKGEYKWAIESSNKALTIHRRASSEDNCKIAASLSNIGSIHAKEGQYSKALHYHLLLINKI